MQIPYAKHATEMLTWRFMPYSLETILQCKTFLPILEINVHVIFCRNYVVMLFFTHVLRTAYHSWSSHQPIETFDASMLCHLMIKIRIWHHSLHDDCSIFHGLCVGYNYAKTWRLNTLTALWITNDNKSTYQKGRNIYMI